MLLLKEKHLLLTFAFKISTGQATAVTINTTDKSLQQHVSIRERDLDSDPCSENNSLSVEIWRVYKGTVFFSPSYLPRHSLLFAPFSARFCFPLPISEIRSDPHIFVLSQLAFSCRPPALSPTSPHIKASVLSLATSK